MRALPGLVAAAVLALMAASPPATALTRRVPAGAGAASAALERAAAGDTVILAAGFHRGPLKIARGITLSGEPGATVIGGPEGSAIEVVASGVVVEDLEVRGSGRDVMRVDAGVHVIGGQGVILRRLRLSEVLYGIYGERATDLVIEDCRLTGTVTPRAERGDGNGIHLWYSHGASVRGTTVDRFLDAVYLSFTNRTRIEDNVLLDCGRYGLHTMYCQDNHLVGNRFTRNVAGCAIMFSNRLRVERNDMVYNQGSRTYGLLLHDCSDGDFRDNRMVANTVAVFMDNSNRNRFRGNLVQDNGWGILLFSSCANNEFAANSFIGNDYPVALDMRRTNNRFDDGFNGNYWSESAPYDLDGDGVGDVPHSPVTAFAFVSKQYPDLTILAKSPAVAALGVAERVFPELRPSEAVDRFPLLNPTPMATTDDLPAVRRKPRPAWGAAAGFLLLSGLGMAGVLGVRRR